MILRPLTRPLATERGFSLIEMLVAGLVSLLTAYVAGDVLLSHLRTAERAESLEQQRENWSRAASFIEADIALSERVFNLKETSDALSISSKCAVQFDESGVGKVIPPGDLRLGLDQGKLMVPVIYFVGDSPQGWLQKRSLFRCGPPFDRYGRSITGEQPEVSLIADGIADGQGFEVTHLFDANGDNALESGLPGKAVSFKLALRGHALNKTFIQEDATQARITPLFVRPTEYSYCAGNAYVKVEGTSAGESLAISIGQVSAGEDILICGRGGGDTIQGSDQANDILEAGDSGGSLISGLGGNDRLRGTNDNDHPDVLNGGDDDDVLIGRGGFDLLNGGCGVNQYLPGTGIDTVYGDGSEYKYAESGADADGNGVPDIALDGLASTCSPYDIVFFPENLEDYTLSESCTNEACTVTAKDGSSVDILNFVEVLIFKNARKDLPSP